jgi:hypothetical protein
LAELGYDAGVLIKVVLLFCIFDQKARLNLCYLSQNRETLLHTLCCFFLYVKVIVKNIKEEAIMKKIIMLYWSGWMKCADLMKEGVFSMNHCVYVMCIKN